MVVTAMLLAVTVVMMLAEQYLSRAHEQALRRQGAVEPPGDVYRSMAWIYPTCFVAMAAEGWQRAHDSTISVTVGLVVFAAAKALKYWAVASLGSRWSFRVLVPPRSSRVETGPYRWLRHPNYVAVMGELAGFAIASYAPATGAGSLVLFATLLRKRIAVEERALSGT